MRKRDDDAEREKTVPLSFVADMVKAVAEAIVVQDRKDIVETMLNFAEAGERNRKLGLEAGLTERDLDTAIAAVRSFVIQFTLKLTAKPMPDLHVSVGDEADVMAQAMKHLMGACGCRPKEKGTIH